ncbi:urate hydroxylase PuuD [Sphingopyxis sp. XHP0097]|uniref:Urate hydroxylase PuuD n=1 Tax=Sphingopyxis jiangsuensis TaxID=2871171 RepID=A0ABS7MFJ4_9SPHN|nr:MULTISPECIES: urate hydroxylase PuuD [Sphingopyxis]MBY4637807.1 urate hydroxylase PuuD [Sphingopyxis jiangsuensis]
MGKFFGNLHAVLGTGLVFAIVLMLGLNGQNFDDGVAAGNAIMRWLHTFFGVLWIGLLYYFNFVQMPTMPKIPAELKPAVGKHIAPAALFWFRWAAAATVLFGLAIAFHAQYAVPALTLQDPYKLIGVGMWLGLIMAFNVWFVIWPNQKKALGIVEADDATKAKAAQTAMIFSRTNTLLSIPMLYAMVNANHG